MLWVFDAGHKKGQPFISMKKAVKISVLFFIISAVALFSGCYPPRFLFGGKYSFFNQPNHEWVSEEYGVRVISHEKGEQCDLIIQSDGKEYAFKLDTRGHRMLYGLDEENMNLKIERWERCRYHSEKGVYNRIFLGIF